MTGNDGSQSSLDGQGGSVEAASDADIDEISETELNAFFGECKYPEQFLTYERKGSRLAGFNFWAAIFAAAWFFYRRLYVQGLAVFVFEVLTPALVISLVLLITNVTDDFSIRLMF